MYFFLTLLLDGVMALPGQVEIDVEAEKRDAAAREEKEASAAAAEELRRFDALLAERERLRQIEQGVRWKP